ncbi:MAG: hypothetical protein MUF71_21900 [Candidatus Kapabacteria bacterium]|jgi:hypothetical protein|nr:hypothetical protein [Candidatus Kapabacteria bacterium]
MNPELFFAHFLQLTTPFSIDGVATTLNGTQITEVILRIVVAQEYRPEGYRIPP